MVILSDRFFYFTLTRISDSCSCSPLFVLFKYNLPEVPEYAKIQFHMVMSFLHNNDVT